MLTPNAGNNARKMLTKMLLGWVVSPGSARKRLKNAGKMLLVAIVSQGNAKKRLNNARKTLEKSRNLQFNARRLFLEGGDPHTDFKKIQSLKKQKKGKGGD